MFPRPSLATLMMFCNHRERHVPIAVKRGTVSAGRFAILRSAASPQLACFRCYVCAGFATTGNTTLPWLCLHQNFVFRCISPSQTPCLRGIDHVESLFVYVLQPLPIPRLRGTFHSRRASNTVSQPPTMPRLYRSATALKCRVFAALFSWLSPVPEPLRAPGPHTCRRTVRWHGRRSRPTVELSATLSQIFPHRAVSPGGKAL